MSHLDTPPFDASAAGPQKTSGLAIASLVCGLICCIPVTTIPAILLGIGAMISIGGDPAKKGKGMAITGITLGVIFSVMQAIVYPWAFGLAQGYYEFLENGPREALVAGYAGDPAGFKAQFFGGGAEASDVEVEAFITQLQDRYGAFVSCHVDEQAGQPQGAFGQPILPFPYVLEFEGAEMSGEAELVFSDPARGGFLKLIQSITVFDPDLGDLTFPAPVADPIEEPTDGDGG